MITVDRARRGTAARRKRVLAQAAGIALTSALVLAGCASAGPADGYIEAYYDNGQPIRSPLKETLFDEAGQALCSTPIYQGRIETRFRSFSDNGGVMNAFLFEVLNNEQDPNAPLGELEIPSGQSEKQYRETLRRGLGSLPRMYQLTHPFLFDSAFGITGPDDMATVKADLRADLPNLVARTAGITQFIAVGDAWVESSAGRFEVGKVGDVEVFMETLGITGVPYDGLNNDYFSAMKDGEQFLMIRNRNTGVVTLVNDKGEADIDEIQQFQQYKALADPGVAESAVALFTLQNDGCPQQSGDNFARWWITNIEPITPASADDDKDPFGRDDVDEDDPFASSDDEPSPSPSAE